MKRRFKANGVEIQVVNGRTGVVEIDAVVFVVREGKVRVAEKTVARLLAPTGASVVEIERDALNGFSPRKMPFMDPAGNAQSVNAFISRRQGRTPTPIPLPVLPKSAEPVMVHAAMGAVAVKEQRRSEAKQILMPLKARESR